MCDIPADYKERLNLPEQIARIDKLLAYTQRQRIELAPWQVVATVLAGGASFFAAGAALVVLTVRSFG